MIYTTVAHLNMRKIERQMIDAVADNIALWSKDNTKVVTVGDNTYVYLHGHMIADIDMETDTMLISACGWKTSTTKSRLNALLRAFTPDRAGIYQKDFQWYLNHGNGDTRVMHSDSTYLVHLKS